MHLFFLQTDINTALYLVKQENFSRTLILTNSKAALLASNNPKLNYNPLVHDTLHKLESLLANRKIYQSSMNKRSFQHQKN